MNNAANNQREGFRRPSYANNKKFQGKKPSNFKPRKKVESETSIKKKMGLKEIPMLDYYLLIGT